MTHFTRMWPEISRVWHSTPRVYLYLSGGLAVALLGAVVYWQTRGRPLETVLRMAETAHTRGEEALGNKNAETALARFQEAQRLLGQVNVAMQAKKVELPPGKSPREFQGRMCYLYARVLRDLAYARAMEQGSSLPETVDSTTGTTFRSYLAIPDGQARGEAIVALRQAALLMPGNEDAVRDALRTELMLNKSWEYISLFTQATLALNPRDARALYILARHEWEQPFAVADQPATPLERRSRTRMAKSLGYLDTLKQIPGAPLWRTLALECQVHHWLFEDFRRGQETPQAMEQEQLLRRLLLDERDGALVRAGRGEGMQNMSIWDVTGLLDLYPLAAEVAADDMGQGMGPDDVRNVLRHGQALCVAVSQNKIPAIKPDKAASMLIAVLHKSQPHLPANAPKDWNDALETVKATLRQDSGKDPAAAAQLADLLLDYSLARQGNLATAPRLRKEEGGKEDPLNGEALHWLDIALKKAATAERPSMRVVELHRLAAKMKWIITGEPSGLAPHLQVLAASGSPRDQALALLLEGALSVESSHMAKGRLQLKQALDTANGAEDWRASIPLAPLYLAADEPDMALACLQRSARRRERFDSLTPFDRAWCGRFVGGEDDFIALDVQAHVRSAQARRQRFRQMNPHKDIPERLIQHDQEQALAGLEKLAPASPPGRLARESLLLHFAGLQHVDIAADYLADLQEDFPASSRVMQLEIALRCRNGEAALFPRDKIDVDPREKLAIDQRLAEFLQAHPRRHAARILWIGWLADSGRAQQAYDYLRDARNFAGMDSPEQRALRTAFARVLEHRLHPQPLLEFVGTDPLLPATLVRLAASLEETSSDPCARQERLLLDRLAAAEDAWQSAKYKDAATGFLAGMGCKDLRALGQMGLLRSLFALADTSPQDARTLIDSFLASHDGEPALLLGYAYGALREENIGTPQQRWDQHKNLTACLSRWRELQRGTREDQINAGLTAARFWRQAQLPARALAELQYNLKVDPYEPRTLQALRQLQGGTPPVLPRVRDSILEIRQLHEKKGTGAKEVMALPAPRDSHYVAPPTALVETGPPPLIVLPVPAAASQPAGPPKAKASPPITVASQPAKDAPKDPPPAPADDVKDYTTADPKQFGIEPVAPTKDPKTSFIVAGKNPTSLVRALTQIAGRPIADLEKDMRPGRNSTKGFLGKDEKLLDVLARDNKYVVDDLGLNHQELAKHLHLLGALAARHAKDKPADIMYHGKKYRLTATFFRAHVNSPFEDGTKTNCEAILQNVATGKKIAFSLLVPHLIERYGFYEGKDTPFRLEPQAVVEVLDFIRPAKRLAPPE